MPQIINTNIASLNAQRQLDNSQKAGDKALQRLSSGLRINSAKDDAAGLAISNRFNAQIRGTSVASRNAGDGVSLAQTAEGALNSMQDSLQRIRELALQSANGSNTDLERSSLQEEVEQLKAEISAIAEKTNFNGRNLLDGSFQDVTFQTGANVGETIDVSIAKVGADTLGTATTNGISTGTTQGTAMAQGDITINGIAVGAADAAADGASTGSQDISGIAIAASINKVADLSGVDAVVNATYAGGSDASSGFSNQTLTINGTAIAVSGSGTAATALADVKGAVEAINARSGETGVTASYDETSLASGVTLSAADGRNIVLSGSSGNLVSANGTFNSGVTLVSRDGSDFTIGTNTGNNLENVGIEIGTYSGSNSGISGGTVGGAALAAGDLVINGVSVGATYASFDNASTTDKDKSAISVAAAINLVSEESGVTAQVNATVATATIASGNQAGSVTLNGVSISFAAGTTGTKSEQVGLAVDAINAKTAQTGVVAEIVDENNYLIRANDGRNIVVGSNTNAGLNDGTEYGSVTLLSGGPIEISTNTSTGPVNAGFAVGSYGGAETGTLLQDIDVSTVAGANAAIKGIDNAINQVSRVQAQLGAVQNRFEATISNLAVQGENLSAANSRIRDADFAAETAALSRAQVLQQAGISVLSQANARPQQALSLLQ